jgi:hypothetical protein
MDQPSRPAVDEERDLLIASRKEQRSEQARRRAEKAAKARAEYVPSAAMARTETRAASSRSCSAFKMKGGPQSRLAP